jgi:crotonobetainyl-CoA:carnitine CoA-transferase CaiB-like acyl-CoA transferase
MPRLPIGLSATAPAIQGRPPKVGEHTRAVLEEAGYSSHDIARFIERAICGAE